jgi:hypothetical protein
VHCCSANNLHVCFCVSFFHSLVHMWECLWLCLCLCVFFLVCVVCVVCVCVCVFFHFSLFLSFHFLFSWDVLRHKAEHRETLTVKAERVPASPFNKVWAASRGDFPQIYPHRFLWETLRPELGQRFQSPAIYAAQVAMR